MLWLQANQDIHVYDTPIKSKKLRCTCILLNLFTKYSLIVLEFENNNKRVHEMHIHIIKDILSC